MITLEETIIGMLEKRGLLTLAVQIAERHHVALHEMLGKTHEKGPSWARHALFYELYRLPGMSYPKIAKLLDRDCSTVIQGIRKHTIRVIRGEAA